jgi:UDP-N-acetylglucosamine transferase subunit ALG13
MADGRLHLVASAGGHLDLLRAIAGAFSGHDCVWVTAPGRAAADLAARGERVRVLPPLDRDHLNLANPRRSVGLALRERPTRIITSGAGFAVPFCAAARLSGAALLFVETMARVRSSSRGGRLLSALARRTFVQWPEMAQVHPGAAVCAPALLEDLPSGPPPPGAGTFVALGSHPAGFARCLRLVDEAVAAGTLPRPVRSQVAHPGYAPRTFEPTSWLSGEEMRAAIAAAEVVVCHGGAGIISSVLRVGRRPLVVPRLRRHGEHVDDHQLEIAAKLAALGLVVLPGDVIADDDVAAARRPLPAVQSQNGRPSLEAAVGAALLRLS